MVIDDALVVRTILAICLRRAGYQVTCFEDGVQALTWLNTAEVCIPDLIFVDLGLPKLDGYQVIRLLKARTDLEKTVLVILSQRDGLLDRLKGRLAGAHAYLTKPFKTREILAVVQTLLEDRGSEGFPAVTREATPPEGEDHPPGTRDTPLAARSESRLFAHGYQPKETLA